MSIDKSKNTQVLLTLSHDLLKKIEDYQFENRIPNRSEAFRTIIENYLKEPK